MDFSAICRMCIKSRKKTPLHPIFVNEETHEKFSSAIYSCTGVQVKLNDGLPQFMCTTCLKHFNNTLKFRKQCKLAESHLLKIKTENEIISDNGHSNEDISIGIIDKKNHENKTPIKYVDKENSLKLKSESNVKIEPSDIDDDQPLKYLSNNKKIINDNIDINNDETYTDNFKKDKPLHKSENYLKIKSTFQTFDTFEDNSDELKCFLYSIPEKRSLIPKMECVNSLNENLANNTKKLTTFEPNVTKDTKMEIPYIVTESLNDKTARVVCKLCQKELSIRSIDSHMVRRHPGADERKVKCELCDRYVMRDKMNRHRVMMHGNVGDTCGYCKSVFKSKDILVAHLDTCTAKKKKRKVYDSGRMLAECDICKMTMQRASLKKHKAVTHAGLRPVCEHCGKSFGNKFRLNEHYRAKHGYEKFQCSRCDFKSAGIMAMRNHERRHRDEKPYVCETCGAKFHASYLLMQHKHSHKTEKLVKCDLCPARFKANNNLHMHKLTCHSNSYYSCTICARSYKCRYYAVKHVRIAHSVVDPGSAVNII